MDAEQKLSSAWEVTEVMLSGTKLVGFLERFLSRTFFLAVLLRVISTLKRQNSSILISYTSCIRKKLIFEKSSLL